MGPRLKRLLPTPPLAVTRYGPGAASGLPPIAEAMATHHLLVSSCGRTIHEAAAVGIPTIGIPVNAREELHARLDSVLYLPRGELVTDHEILNVVGHLLDSQTLRAEMSVRGQARVDGRGAQRIASIITDLIEGL
jgi:spore coat polysaccharide biosynthesis predicted glycosyltransferase SpsG